MDTLREHFERFSQLVALGERCLERGDLGSAVGVAEFAAFYVFRSKALFASPRLERLLGAIGARIPVDPPAPRTGEGRRNVLHVLTHAQLIGGDSRCVWRWMQRDARNRQSVAVTAQEQVSESLDVPEIFLEAARASGGSVHVLRAPSSQPLEKARELRRVCQNMDVVALHLYPYDVIPSLALAAGCDSAKALLINHADHGFWVGGGAVHSVVNLRRQANFLGEQRGLDRTRSGILPIPLAAPPPQLNRAEAKRALGYGADTVVLLTIATPFKYSSPGRVGFLELVVPVLEKFPQAVLVAVGPDFTGDWRAASARVNGRLVAHGIRADTDGFYAAADVYLDPVPFSSITSLLEAGGRGLPLLGWRLEDEQLSLLGPGAPGLEGAMQLAGDPDSYRLALGRLISDEAFRLECGSRTRESILSAHTGSGWDRALDGLYEVATRTSDKRCLVAERDNFAPSALSVALVELYSSVPSSLRKYTRAMIGPLPYFARVSVSWRLYRLGLGLSLLNLLPSPIDRIVHGLARKVARRLRKALRRS